MLEQIEKRIKKQGVEEQKGKLKEEHLSKPEDKPEEHQEDL